VATRKTGRQPQYQQSEQYLLTKGFSSEPLICRWSLPIGFLNLFPLFTYRIVSRRGFAGFRANGRFWIRRKIGLRQDNFAFRAYSTFRRVEALSREIKEAIVVALKLDACRCVDNSTPTRAPKDESLLGYDASQSTNCQKTQTDLSIGIVVPVLNEGDTLRYFLSRLYEVSRGHYPVVVVDGGSTDDSVSIARQFFHSESILTQSRGMQMNHGAGCLLTEVLLFLHADSELPRGFDFHIRRALADPAILGGCFRLEFDAPHPLLKFYAWFTRFPGRFFHYGDQGFFIRRHAFWKMGGFSPWPFLEDVDFLHRLKRFGKFVVLPTSVRTSARRFMKRGVVRQQLANVLLVALFELGVSAERLAKFYQQVR
jgi:rSAM/selenodomain-associated transferase 2